MRLSWWAIIEILAAVKVIAGLAILTVVGPPDPPTLSILYAAHVFAYAGAGGLLLTTGRHDRRAVSLGLFLLILATVWSDRLLYSPDLPQPVAAISYALRFSQISAFAPFFFWRFVRDFPTRRDFQQSRLFQWIFAVTLTGGAFLFVLNCWIGYGPTQGRLYELAAIFNRENIDSHYWSAIFGLGLPAIGYAAWQARHASAVDSRRVRLLLAGIVFGLMPEILITMGASISSSFEELIETDIGSRILDVLIYPTQLAVPFLTAYAVLVHRALDLRLIVRRAVQYAFARQSVVTITASPFLVVLGLMYLQREQPMAAVWSGPLGLFICIAVAAGATMNYFRRPILETIDRRFYREQYDARRILSDLVQQVARRQTTQELFLGLSKEIDRALHLERVEFLVVDSSRGTLESPGRAIKPLDVSSKLVRRLEASSLPLEVDWSRGSNWVNGLPETERTWIAESRGRLLVPAIGATGLVVGILVLGEKKSELPFSREDRELLSTIGTSLAISIERRMQSSSPQATGSINAAEAARECLMCGTITDPDLRRCPLCGDSTVIASVPALLAGKFRVRQRVGTGAMGIVYRALDVSLDRDVALKTLSGVKSEDVARLRREARAMAAVSHPNLAMIFGVESWEGLPILVVEYLAGGTLAERLRHGPVSTESAFSLGVSLASALEVLHDRGIFHRDIKPSNIGFTDAGLAKLLDFGLAKMLESFPLSETGDSEPPETSSFAGEGTGVAGTPLYLSPEIINGSRARVGGDLWALAIVLYESIAGEHPFAREESLGSLFIRIRTSEVPDIRVLNPSVAPPVAAFFSNALSPDPMRRPQSAGEFSARLLDLRPHLGGSHESAILSVPPAAH